MLTFRDANEKDAAAINAVTHKAFRLYADELSPASRVKALEESDEAVIADIAHNKVIVAEEDGKILGSIRVKKLSPSLAYVFRFGVDPTVRNAGLGSKLLQAAIDYCESMHFAAITLHTNAKYYKLARYYYGKQFYVHSTSTEKGYIRALFVKELTGEDFDISPAHKE